MIYKFKQTVKHTEIVTIEADSLKEAEYLLFSGEGEYEINHDDVVVTSELVEVQE